MNQTSPSSPSSPFLRVPNIIIQHSLLRNHYILPLYLYSGIHTNPNYFNIVDTNLSLISETFAPSNPSAPAKFQESLIYLLQDIPDTENLPGFSQPLELYAPNINIENFYNTKTHNQLFSKTSRIQYLFLNRTCKMTNSWTKFTYDEYFYILDRIDMLNSSNKTSQKLKYNAIELLNLYLYFKQKINFYSYSQAKFNSQTAIKTYMSMHESLDTIITNTTFSRNTLTKYTNQLIELGLISVKRGAFKNNDSKKECNEYYLSDKWIDYYNEMNYD